MKGSRIARISCAAAVAFALPIGGAVALSAGPAGAAFVGITCTALSGGSATITVSHCNGNTGGAWRTFSTFTFIGAGGTIPWVNGLTTDVGASTGTLITTGATRPISSTKSEDKETGLTLGDTTGSAPVGGKYTVFVCITHATGAVSRAPSKKVKIG
jgi:hypothetical protein